MKKKLADLAVTAAVVFLSIFLRKAIQDMNDHHDYGAFPKFDRWRSS